MLDSASNALGWKERTRLGWGRFRTATAGSVDGFKDFSERIFDVADRSRVLSWIRRQFSGLFRGLWKAAVSFGDRLAEDWQRVLLRHPRLADAIFGSKRTFTKVLATCRSFCRNKPWAPGALLSTMLFAIIYALEAALGHPSGIQALYILPIWLGTRLAGPVVGFGGVLAVSALLATLDERAVPGPMYFQPNALLRLGALTLLMLFISQVEFRLATAQKQARLDPLTGVLNRFEVEKRIGFAIQAWQARRGNVSLAVVDCDRFKEVNDQYGHAFGDHVLRVLARRLQSVAKNQGLVGRLGGDEFVVLYDGLDEADAQERLKAAAHGFKKYLAGMGFPTTISYGVVQVDEKIASVNRLIEAADRAMYSEKRNGRPELR